MPPQHNGLGMWDLPMAEVCSFPFFPITIAFGVNIHSYIFAFRRRLLFLACKARVVVRISELPIESDMLDSEIYRG